MAVTFDLAVGIKQVDTHEYQANLQHDWCIGSGIFRDSLYGYHMFDKHNQSRMADMSHPASWRWQRPISLQPL